MFIYFYILTLAYIILEKLLFSLLYIYMFLPIFINIICLWRSWKFFIIFIHLLTYSLTLYPFGEVAIFFIFILYIVVYTALTLYPFWDAAIFYNIYLFIYIFLHFNISLWRSCYFLHCKFIYLNVAYIFFTSLLGLLSLFDDDDDVILFLNF